MSFPGNQEDPFETQGIPPASLEVHPKTSMKTVTIAEMGTLDETAVRLVL